MQKTKTHILLFKPDGKMERIPLLHKVTTIGGGGQCEIAIPSDENITATILHDGEEYYLEPVNKKTELFINGSKAKKHKLTHGDLLRFKDVLMIYWQGKLPLFALPEESAEKQEISILDSLIKLGNKLANTALLNDLLTAFLDDLLLLTKGDTGFIILKGVEQHEWEIKFARSIEQKDIFDSDGHISDTIVERALNNGEIVTVFDTLSDKEFSASRSVLNLKLNSVLCIPLKARGELIGCLYLGSHKVGALLDPHIAEFLNAFSASVALLIKNALLINELALDNKRLKQEIEKRRFGEIVGSSAVMQLVFDLVRKVAPTDASVLIEGETGTGKELIAREIHRLSSRADKPFVAISCGSIPATLLESELFGYKRGAFTGAVTDRKGKVVSADGGTLFLDEIGELPPELQVKLLRLLQEKKITPIGENKETAVDIRIIAATNKVLSEEIAKKSFRSDLYYRLSVVNIMLPPLRNRGEDILLLARHFLDNFIKEYNTFARKFSNASIAQLVSYSWPGNVRELENIIRQAVVLARNSEIQPEDIKIGGTPEETIKPLSDAKNDYARQYVENAVRLCGGNRSKASELLGVDARTIRRILNEEQEESKS